MKILLIGFSSCPDAGSEPGTSWNWAWHLAAENEVWAIVHPQHRPAVEAHVAKHYNPRLHLVFVKVPDWLDPWDFNKSERGLRFSYLLWLRAALKVAKRLHRQNQFHVVHQVTMGTVSAPSPMWKLGIPFIWGSLGGGQVAPPAFRRYFGSTWRSEVIRSLRVRLLPFMPGLRRSLAHSALVLATNSETASLARSAGAKNVRLFLDCGTLPKWVHPSQPLRAVHNKLSLLWSGRLEPRKGLPLALEALSQVKDERVELKITGEGPNRQTYEELVRILGLENRVQFLGYVPSEALPKLFYDADAFLFTSLRDSSGSVVLEAMANGLPVIVLDHHGVGGFVPQEAGVKIPVTNPSDLVQALARAIRRLLNSPNERRDMGEAGWKFANSQTWDRRASQMIEWYGECLTEQTGPASTAARPAPLTESIP